MNYQLLAADMDGTVLTSRKTISLRTVEAIRRALAQGFQVLFATGRSLAEMREYLALFPEMRYLICCSGGAVTDLRTGADLSSATLDPAIVEQVREGVRGMDITLAYYIGSEIYLDSAAHGRLEHYNCSCFNHLFETCGTWTDDPHRVFLEHPEQMRKLNLFFHSREEYARAGAFLSTIPVNHPSGIPNNYEVSPTGVSKGTGLKCLCDHLGLSIEQAIACGDEGNDLEMISMVGLGVAMGNATGPVRAAADTVTADCDHDGVAEAIETYLGRPVLKRTGQPGAPGGDL